MSARSKISNRDRLQGARVAKHDVLGLISGSDGLKELANGCGTAVIDARGEERSLGSPVRTAREQVRVARKLEDGGVVKVATHPQHTWENGRAEDAAW